MFSDDSLSVSGMLRIDIFQLIMGFSGGVWKQSFVCTNRHDQNIFYGSNNFNKIPELFDGLAINAANDLSKAGETPLLNQ
jgi:hypothetical protein